MSGSHPSDPSHHYEEGGPMIGGFGGVAPEPRPRKAPVSAADRAAVAASWAFGLLLGSIILGALLWVAVRIWKDIPW